MYCGESNSESAPLKILMTFLDSEEVFPPVRFDIKMAKTSAQNHFYGLKFDLTDSFLMFFKSVRKFFENSKFLLFLGIMFESNQYFHILAY